MIDVCFYIVKRLTVSTEWVTPLAFEFRPKTELRKYSVFMEEDELNLTEDQL